MDRDRIIAKCKTLLGAYNAKQLGYMRMPEDDSPVFWAEQQELRSGYFTLPMSLNYQRDSYKLWSSALRTFEDAEARAVFDVSLVTRMNEEMLRGCLMRYKVALQPNKHVATWNKIAHTISDNWGTFGNLFEAANHDFLRLREIIQYQHKSGFPYLSGPKIFHYWSSIIQRYGGIKLTNSEYIEIAPDTHVIQCSVRLGVMTEQEAQLLSKEQISERWRMILEWTGIAPIDMHSPLWFWSRNDFQFQI